MDISILPQVLVSGLAVGGVYALIASGLTVAFAVSRQINLIHAHFVVVALYLIFIFQKTWGIDPYISVLVNIPILFCFGVMIFWVIVKPLLNQNIIIVFQVFVASLLVIQNALLIIFKMTPRKTHSFISMEQIFLGENIILPLSQALAVVVSVIIGIVGYWFLKKTAPGRSIRAVAYDSQAAALMGINVPLVQCSVFGLSFVLIAIAASLIAPTQWFDPNIGTSLLIFSIIIIVVGGLGNFLGALIVGFALGMIEAAAAFFIGNTMSLAVPYILFLIVFIVKPRGLLA